MSSMLSGYAAMLQGTMLQVKKSNDVKRKLDQMVEIHNVAQSGPIQWMDGWIIFEMLMSNHESKWHRPFIYRKGIVQTFIEMTPSNHLSK